ncbi:MAG TPA: hypothetical protein VFT45_16645 [Longimicrobium sp.]|nr:hypothetical protein [Longimicrobium sp.]
MKRFVVRSGALLALMTLALPACSSDGLLGPEATVFLTQKSPPGNTMDALYTGTVNRDAQGCLRTADDGAAVVVVIWPYGFNLKARSGGLYVEDAEGRTVGRIGGEFRFGGGQADAEYVDTYLSQSDRARASVCHADKYWIASGID